MFDSVGRNEKRQASRQVGALLLSFAVNGSFFAALVYAGTRVVEEVTAVEVIEVAVDLAPPPPPPPPPPAGGSKKPKTEKKPTPNLPILVGSRSLVERKSTTRERSMVSWSMPLPSSVTDARRVPRSAPRSAW